MRQKKNRTEIDDRSKILIVDDEQGVIDSLTVVLSRNGYNVKGTIDPLSAVKLVKNEHFDLLILDFLMFPIHGDEVVRLIREFNKEIYILLLTGHKDLAPPIETIRILDIQGYCEKSDRFDQLILLVESGIKSVYQMETVKKLKDGLNKILQAVPKIYQLQPIGNILEDILTEIMPLINGESAFIIIDDIFQSHTDNNTENKTIYRGIGSFKFNAESFLNVLKPELMQHIGEARMTHEIIELDNGMIIPLLDESRKSIGVLYIEGNDISQGKELIKIYASQAASSLNNAFLHSLVNTKNDELNKTYNMLKRRYMDTIEALRLVVDAKDVYTRGHSDRVSYYSYQIGEFLGITEEDLEILRIGGLFHDVGKIGTADDILLKNEKLNNKEFEEIKKHPLKGAQILSAISMFKDIVPIVKQHHERFDGKGYPEGLHGDEINFLARIVTVADAFDAMMSDRMYRSKLSFEAAISQLTQGIGTQFDENVVNAFISVINNMPDILNEIDEKVENFNTLKRNDIDSIRL